MAAESEDRFAAYVEALSTMQHEQCRLLAHAVAVRHQAEVRHVDEEPHAIYLNEHLGRSMGRGSD